MIQISAIPSLGTPDTGIFFPGSFGGTTYKVSIDGIQRAIVQTPKMVSQLRSINGDAGISGTLLVTGVVSALQTVNIGANVTHFVNISGQINQFLGGYNNLSTTKSTLRGAMDVSGNLSVGTTSSNQTNISGGLKVFGANVEMDKMLKVSGGAELNGLITGRGIFRFGNLTGNSELYGGLTVDYLTVRTLNTVQGITVSQNITGVGAQFTSIEVKDNTLIGENSADILRVRATTTSESLFNINNSCNILSNFIVSGTSQLYGNTTIGTSTSNLLTINGVVNAATGVSAGWLIARNASISNNLKVSGSETRFDALNSWASAYNFETTGYLGCSGKAVFNQNVYSYGNVCANGNFYSSGTTILDYSGVATAGLLSKYFATSGKVFIYQFPGWDVSWYSVGDWIQVLTPDSPDVYGARQITAVGHLWNGTTHDFSIAYDGSAGGGIFTNTIILGRTKANPYNYKVLREGVHRNTDLNTNLVSGLFVQFGNEVLANYLVDVYPRKANAVVQTPTQKTFAAMIGGLDPTVPEPCLATGCYIRFLMLSGKNPMQGTTQISGQVFLPNRAFIKIQKF
jgi:hypothetical protein